MNSLNKILLIVFIILLIVTGIEIYQNNVLVERRKENLNLILEDGAKSSEESIRRVDRIYELEDQLGIVRQ